MAGDQAALQVLERGLSALGLGVDSRQQKTMLAFLEILKRWNRIYNLTAIEPGTKAVTRHLLDSLAVVPYLHGDLIIDIGSGAGLPGIPVSLACPEKHVVLLDSNAKRCRFLRQVKAELKLDNVEVVQDRAENYQRDAKFDSLLSRAFSELAAFIRASGHLLAEGGKILAMKGCWDESMAENLPADFAIEDVIRLNVPGLDEERHLVICSKRN